MAKTSARAKDAPPQAAKGGYAGFPVRAGALAIDTAIVGIVDLLLLSAGVDELLVFFPAIAYAVVPTGLWGQTAGKWAFRIKVVRANGRPPGVNIAFLREVPAKLLSTAVLFIGFFWVIHEPRKQAWHDKLASTFVVRVVRGSAAA